MRVASTWSRSQPEAPAPAPRLGEHSVEVLKQAGYAPADIEALLAAGVVRQAERAGGSG
jgi:crotonobetainyl-CoA:carnitine CoA-transferase CaiB-like acyl-CoA transferase